MNMKEKPLVSIIICAYNEAIIMAKNLKILYEHMETLDNYNWEMVIINDGSIDRTGKIATEFAAKYDNVNVYHHKKNYGLGQSFQYAFTKCNGNFVVTLDIDLSYAPQHIERLLNKLIQGNCKMVLASPYMRGGKILNVPWLRRKLSIWANRFLAFLSRGHLSTLTCMVRAYDGRFIKSLNLRAPSMGIMPEMIYKAMIMSASIEQIPATLEWEKQQSNDVTRKSSMRIKSHVLTILLSGFIMRPFMFFFIPGLIIFLFSTYVNIWMLVHLFVELGALPGGIDMSNLTLAFANAYAQYPHTFVIGFLSFMLAMQLFSLSIQTVQSKSYFEELFHISSKIYSKQNN